MDERMERYTLYVDGVPVAVGRSCFALNEVGWARLEAGAARFEVWSSRRDRAVITQEWGKHWARANQAGGAVRVVATPCGPLLLEWSGMVAADLGRARVWLESMAATGAAARLHGWTDERRARYAEAAATAREWLTMARDTRRRGLLVERGERAVSR